MKDKEHSCLILGKRAVETSALGSDQNGAGKGMSKVGPKFC